MILKSFANLLAFLAVSIQYVCARDFNVADFGADPKAGEEKCASATDFTTAIAYG